MQPWPEWQYALASIVLLYLSAYLFVSFGVNAVNCLFCSRSPLPLKGSIDLFDMMLLQSAARQEGNTFGGVLEEPSATSTHTAKLFC